MGLTLAVTGSFGHAEAEFAGERITITYKKTTSAERGTIETLVQKAVKKGMKLYHEEKEKTLSKVKKAITGKKEELALKPLENILDVLMDKKGCVVLEGEKSVVESLALETVEEEVKAKRIVSEAQEDGTWKVLTIGEFKMGEKKKAVTSHAVPVGG